MENWMRNFMRKQFEEAAEKEKKFKCYSVYKKVP
jgi:hypothetical protein